VRADALEEIMTPVSALLDAGCFLVDAEGAVIWGVYRPRTAGDVVARRKIRLFGRLMGELRVGPLETESDGEKALLDHACAVLVAFLRETHRGHLTSQIHRAALDDLAATVTDRDDRLARTQAQLREVDRLKSNFLSTISHELRTPLTSVIGYAEMMQEGLAGDVSRQQQECLSTILDKADELLQLISGLLDASLLEARSLSIAAEPVSLPEVAESVTSLLAAEARRRNVSISLEPAFVPRAHGDSQKIRQVLLHLVANAIKFSPEGGGVAIALDVAPMSPKDQPSWAHEARAPSGRLGLRLRISDRGIGIDEEQKDRVFDPFYQVDSSSTREFGGTGLGLSLAKLYVEAHGGYIWVESTLGEGTTFTVTIPAVAEELRRYAARRLAETRHE